MGKKITAVKVINILLLIAASICLIYGLVVSAKDSKIQTQSSKNLDKITDAEETEEPISTEIEAEDTTEAETEATDSKTTSSETKPAETTPVTKTLTSISIALKPKKTSYVVGEKLDTSQLRLILIYSDGSTAFVTSGFSCSPTTLSKEGSQTITVSYGGKSSTFNVTVNAVTLSSISISSMPTKTSYYVGDILNTSGLKLSVKYNNGKTETISGGFSCSPTALNKEGPQYVTVTYQGKTIQFNVTVKPQGLANVGDVGEYITFGKYEQDNDANNGKEDIEWLILAKENGKALLISKYGLDCQPYNTSWTTVTWENCSLRAWLNGTFLNNAFSSEEQAVIATTNVSTDKNPEYSTDSGNATTDKVFILNITEAEKYFTNNESRMCVPTAYVKAQGAGTISGYETASGELTCCWWWLRTPGVGQNYAADVIPSGQYDYFGSGVYSPYAAVRPAMWINLDS